MSMSLIKALLSSNYDEAFNLLLKRNFTKNSKTKAQGLTAVHLAASNGYAHMLKIMAKLGFDIDATSKRGLTPLHYAVMKQHVAATRVLIAMNANINAKDVNGITPLHLAVVHNTSAGVAITQVLLAAKANPNIVDRDKTSPLHEATLANAYSQVRLLVQSQANPNLKDEWDYTPIECAVEKKYDRIKTFLSKVYIDENASDTDSEDVTDYQFFDEYAPNIVEKKIK